MRPWYRIHFSTLFVLAIVLAALVFINIPGDRAGPYAHISPRFYHGWPHHYFDRDGSADSYWSFAGTAPRSHGWALLLNVLTALSIVALVAWACELWIRRNGRLLRFGTRSLLVGTTLVAGLFGLVADDVRRCARQQQVLQELARHGSLEINRDLRRFDWLRSLFGDHFHGKVRGVGFTATRPMNRLPDLSALDSVTSLGLQIESIPENIDQITKLSRLQYLAITLTSLADADRRRLTALTKLPQLRSLGLLGDQIDDAVVLLISSDTQLEAISISSPRITERSLSRLSQLKMLSELTLDEAVVQNRDCSALARVSRLAYLNFIGNRFTVKDKIEKLWPDARVVARTSAIAPTSAVRKPSLIVLAYEPGRLLNTP